MFRTASSASTAGRSRRYNVDPMYDNQSVHWAMMHSFARDPEYAKAVLRSYIEVKRSRGRLANDISLKLNVLEQQLPQFAEAFHAVRAEYRLPPSRVLPNTGLTPTTSRLSLTPSISRLSQHGTAPASPRRSSERIRRTTPPDDSALPADFRVRPEASADEELPPPPYARQDPEPDSTMLLQERLAAEAARTLPPDTSPRPSSTRNDSRRPSSTSQRPQVPQRTPSPPHRPEDEEMARAMEENELEEAKRASMALERERLELEEAMRLSLADGAGNAVAGGSGPGPSRLPVFPEAQLAPIAPSPAPKLGMPGGLSLLDADDSAEAVHQAPLVPQKTGAVMQSKNPFLSAADASPSHSRLELGGSPARSRTVSQSAPPVTDDKFDLQEKALPPSPARRALPRPPTSQSGLQAPNFSFSTTSPNQHAEVTIPPIANGSRHISAYTALQPSSADSAPQEVTPGVDPDDPFHSLTYYDIVFLVDDSPSMAGRWERAKDVLMQVAGTAMRYSADGVDVYFTSSKRVGRELRSKDDVEELLGGLQPRGNASTGHRLRNVLRDYMERLPHELFSPGGATRREVRPMNLIVITDGVCAAPCLCRRDACRESGHALSEVLTQEPEDDLERVIVDCARDLDRDGHPSSQIGIQFIQIGDDNQAAAALRLLDDDLATAYEVRDIVDTVPIPDDEMVLSAERIRKTLFGGIDRGWDNYNVE